MFLKALTLKGFKSFADTTHLEFEPGVTVVVGPNGSGKSNVVDAVGWVLGAQAPSAVRSQKMDDVIFAGTSKRSALGRAEVGLTLDNASGLLPIEFSEVTVTRTLWRSGDSEYAINGVPCRLLDIQELFSDTGVGRQQHVIVGQGQIDTVLNARPEDRRMIVEEAAGVLKHRKRKERSERRLASTEGNLQRLQDLQKEVRRQLRPLERQAEAARRHGELVAELRELQVHLIGRDLATLQRRLGDAAAARSEAGSEERVVQTRLADLDSEILAVEGELGRVGGDDVGEALGRVDTLRERGRGLLALLSERQRGLERERAAFVDHAVVASLEDDAAKLTDELASLDGRSAELAPQVRELEAEEARLAAEREDFETTYAEDGAAGTTPGTRARQGSGRAAEVRGELQALRASAERGGTDVERARQRLEQLNERVGRLGEEATRLEGEVTAAEESEADLVDAAEAAELTRTAAEASAQQAEERYRVAEAERHALDGRVEALGIALDEARSRAGAEQLADVEGLVGTLLDLVDIDRGWEAAVEAACGEALGAVVVDSVEAGRAAAQVLARGDLPGAVLAVGAARPDLRTPPVGEPVRSHVRAREPGVDPLLDALLGPAVLVGPMPGDGGTGGGEGTATDAVVTRAVGEDAVLGALDVALAHPDAVVVTATGGRFATSGWRAVTATTGATGAALDAAREQAIGAAQAAEAARREHEEAGRALEAARDAHDVAQRTLDEHRRSAAATAERRDRARRDREEAEGQVESLSRQLAEAEEQVEREQDRLQELEDMLPDLEAEEEALEAEQAAAEERAKTMAKARLRLDQWASQLAGTRKDLDVEAASIEDRRTFLTQRLEEVRERLARTTDAWQEAEQRRRELDRTSTVLDRLATYVNGRLEEVEAEHETLQARRQEQNEAQREIAGRLERLRSQRQEVERSLEETRERGRRAEIDEAEVRLRLEQTTESCRTQFDVEPHTAINTPLPELPDGVAPAARVRELERELRHIGPINPLALEEYESLQERYQFLQSQLDDVRASRRELNKVIRAVDEEIVRVFGDAFADVNENFTQLFGTLFPGGEGRLRLTAPDELLTTGIEIEAKPSGKNVKKLSLLSGGERSLTALAFLFAVFRSRPSPFYVMDEVEAALDDVNLHRFLSLVAEFRREAQLVIVSHQKRTMEAAECLYGVTMQPGGSSKVVSEKVSA